MHLQLLQREDQKQRPLDISGTRTENMLPDSLPNMLLESPPNRLLSCVPRSRPEGHRSCLPKGNSREVVYCDEPSDPGNPGPLPITTLPKHATMQTRITRIGTDIVNVEMITDDGGHIPAEYQDLSYRGEIQALCERMQHRYGNSRTAPFMSSKRNSWGRAVLARRG